MSSQRNWGLDVDSSVFKELKRMPRYDAEVVLEVIRLLPTDPFFGDVQKMRGEDNVWRRRIGVWRIFYKLKIPDRTILVFHIERRSSRTYSK